jgi:hypothetical protein
MSNTEKAPLQQPSDTLLEIVHEAFITADDFRPLLTRWELRLYGAGENAEPDNEYMCGYLAALDRCLNDLYDLLSVTSES